MPIVQKVIQSLIPAGTNVSGFVPYTGFDFMDVQVEVSITGSGGKTVRGLAPGPEVEVYPGTSPSNGDLKFTRDLYPGEVVIMSVAPSFFEVRATAEYNSRTNQLKLLAWTERDGERHTNPQTASARILLDDVLVTNLGTQNDHDSLGIFTFAATVTLPKGRTHIIDISILTDEGPKSTNLAIVNH